MCEKKLASFSLIFLLLDIFPSRAVSHCFDSCPENASITYVLSVQPSKQQQQYLSDGGILREIGFARAKGNKLKNVTRLTEMETS